MIDVALIGPEKGEDCAVDLTTCYEQASLLHHECSSVRRFRHPHTLHTRCGILSGKPHEQFRDHSSWCTHDYLVHETNRVARFVFAETTSHSPSADMTRVHEIADLFEGRVIQYLRRFRSSPLRFPTGCLLL
jgi:hypothetical protein